MNLLFKYKHAHMGVLMKDTKRKCENHKDLNSMDVVKKAGEDYFDSLNKSLSQFRKHRKTNEQELKRGTRITSHRISL